MKAPKEWLSKFPGQPDIHAFLMFHKQNLQKGLAEFAEYAIPYVWERAPFGVNNLNNMRGGWYVKTPEGIEHAKIHLAHQLWREGTYVDQPFALATQCSALAFHFGQCTRKGHLVMWEVAKTPQKATPIPPEFSGYILKKGLPIHSQFREQLLVCQDHEKGICQTCKHAFMVLKQEPRFWVAKSEECGVCLSHQLVYVDRKHNPRSLIYNKEGRRQLWRLPKWAIKTVPVPKGIPEAAAAAAGPIGIPVPNLNTAGNVFANAFSNQAWISPGTLYTVDSPPNPDPYPPELEMLEEPEPFEPDFDDDDEEDN